MPKTIIINGTDFTSWTTPAGYEVNTKSVYGGNKTVMSTGGEFKDEVALLSVVTLPFMPLTETQLSTLTQKLYEGQTCTVYFFDPDVKQYRTMTANRQLDKRKYRGKGADGNDYWTPVICTFEEYPT